MKRPAPASPPPAKRAHTSSSRSSGSQEHQQHQHQRATISHLSDELFLHILQQLDYESLAIAQRVSSHWLRLARDNQLWKQLFLRDHSHKHLRSVSTQGTGRRRAHDPFRPLAPLPHRPPRPPAEREEGPLDWRWMYRLSQNWATGFCTLSSLPVPLPPAAAPPAPHPQQTESKTLPFAPSRLQLLGPYILLASPTSSILHVLLPPSRSTPLTLLGSLPLFTGADATGPATCLAPCTLPTTSSKNTSFAAFSPRGSIVLHTLPLPPRAELAPRRTHAYTPPGGVGRQIRAAALHGELLVTLNSNFTLHLFHVPPPPPPSPSPAAAESAQLTLMQTLYSFTPFPPASLSLSFPPRPSPSDPRPAAQKAKLTLHHLLPAYPAHWVPSAHQFHITLPASSSTSASQQKSTYEITRTQSWSVAGFLPSTLAAESSENDSPPGTGVGGKGKGRVRKLAHVGAVGGDSRTSLVVGDGALHVYKLKPSSAHLRPTATFVLPAAQSGQGRGTGRGMMALAVDEHAPRCVLARGEGVVVFDLSMEGGEGVGLPRPSPRVPDSQADSGQEERNGTLTEVRFDEGRVVGLLQAMAGGAEERERVVVWDFDC